MESNTENLSVEFTTVENRAIAVLARELLLVRSTNDGAVLETPETLGRYNARLIKDCFDRSIRFTAFLKQAEKVKK